MAMIDDAPLAHHTTIGPDAAIQQGIASCAVAVPVARPAPALAV